MKSQHQKNVLKSNYTILFQLSLILSLSVMLALTKISIPSPSDLDKVTISSKDDPIIQQPPIIPPKDPPPPIKPLVPIEVSDDVFIEDEIDFPNLEIGDFEYLPPKPPIDSFEEKIYDINGIEILPSMIGGLKKLYSEIQYPEIARKTGIEGIVTVEFIVNKMGEVENPQIIRGIGGGCDEEVLRVIKEMKFSPGIQNGILVKVKMSQSIRFQLKN